MRILLRDLSPSTNYALQLRSVAGEEKSDWSRVFDITTSSDTTPPKKPANVSNTMSGTSFILKWDAVTQSVDNSPASDLDYYQVSVKSSGSANVGTFITKDTKFEFTLSRNLTLFGVPQPNVQMAVQAVDKVGNTDGYTAYFSQTNPAPADVTGLTASPISNAISVSWNANTDDDLLKYIAYVGTSAAFAPGPANKVWEGNSTSFEFSSISYSTDLYVKVVAVDVFRTPSVNPATFGPVRPLNPTSVDTTAPGVPAGLSATLTNATDGKSASAAVTWTAVADPDNDLSEYIVAFRQKATPVNEWQYTKVDYTATATTIQGLVPYVDYDFRIRASDFSANLSNWSTIVTATAVANTAPAVPTGLALSAGRDNLQISWNENSEVDMKNNAGTYDVTVATNSGFTTGVLQYRTGNTTLAINGLLVNTQYWARVRAVDSSGLPSAYSASVNATTGNFPTTALSDGNPPASSPVPTGVPGIGHIVATWTPIANNDLVMYEVHLGTTSGFTANSSSKVAEIAGSSIVLRTNAAGAALSQNTNYYLKTIAKDTDGAAAASAASAVVQMGKATIGDISATPRQLGVPIITTSATAPSSPIAGDVWNDTTTGLEKQWTGSAWLPTGNVSDTYVNNAVQTAANGKNNITYSTSDASGTNFINGDTWRKVTTLGAGGKIIKEWTFNSGAWTTKVYSGLTLTDLDAGSITTGFLDVANRIQAGALTISQVSNLQSTINLAPNKVNNPTRTGTVDNWITSPGGSLAIDTKDFFGTSIKAMKSTSSGTTQNYSDFFEVDITKAYEVRMWVQDPTDSATAGTQFYLGLNVADSGLSNQNLLSINPTTGAVGSTNSNPYFYTTTTETAVGDWREHVAYVFPYGALPEEMAGLGKNVSAHYQFTPNTSKMRVRFLNWNNTSAVPRDLWVANVSVTEMSIADIRSAALVERWRRTGTTNIDGGNIETNTIRAKSIAIADFENYLSGSDWEDTALMPWVLANGAVIDTAQVKAGTKSLKIPGVTGPTKATYPQFSVVPGDQYYIHFWAYRDAAWNGTSGGSKLRIVNQSQGGTVFGVGYGSTDLPAGVWTEMSAIYTVPSTSTGLNITLSGDATAGNIWIDNIEMRRMNSGSLIIDGTLGANKVTAGTYTGGEFIVGPGGIIRTNTGGVSITDTGIIIPAGMLDANVLKGNTAFITTLNIGAGGAIQSTGYTAGGTTGFRLDSSSLVIKGTGNVVDGGTVPNSTLDVNALKTSTLTTTTLNIGAGGIINIDSTGQVKSNNYASGSTGYKLSNTGLEINDGSIDAKVLKTNSAVINELVIGQSANSNGTLRSFDYVAGSAGWKIGKGLFEINNGTVAAAALQIQNSQNLVPAQYASFEFTPSFYSSFGRTGTVGLPNVESTRSRFGSQSVKITNGGTVSALYFNTSNTDYNIQIDASRKYIASFFVYHTNVATQTVRVRMLWDNATTTDVNVSVAPNTWVRCSGLFTPPAGTTSAAVGAIVPVSTQLWFDGVQLEEQMGALSTPSTWTPPGITSVDGGIIRSGEIRSNTNVTVNGTSQPMWSINMSGGAQFGSAFVRGSLVIGAAGADVDAGQSFVASGNYVSSTTGWKMDSSGNLEANSGSIRGNMVVKGTLDTSALALGVLKTNPINNPGFEDSITWTDWLGAGQGDTESWRYLTPTSAQSVARYAGNARSGTYRAMLAINSGGNTSTIADLYSNTFAVKAGGTYTVTWSAVSTNAGAVAAGGKLYVAALFGATNTSVAPSATTIDLGDGFTVAPYAATVGSDGYTTFSGEMTIPAGQTDLWCAIRFRSTGNPASTWIMIDDVACIQQGIGGATEVTPSGFRLFSDTGSELGAFVSNRPNYISVSSPDSGAVVAGIDPAGGISGVTGAFVGDENNLSVYGDAVGALTVGGIDYADRLASLPQGVISQVYRNSPLNIQRIRTEYGIYEIAFTAQPGRHYRILFQGGTLSANTGAPNMMAVARVRRTLDGSTPDINSPVIRSTWIAFPTNGVDVSIPTFFFNGEITGGASGPVPVRLIYTLGTVNAGATDYMSLDNKSGTTAPSSLECIVEDLGVDPSDTWQGNRGGGVLYTGGNDSSGGTTPTAQKKTYTSTWTANSVKSRRGTSVYGNNTINTSAPTGYTLAGYYSSSNGNQYTYLGFTGTNSAGQSIGTAISGATVKKVELFVKNATFYSSSGGSQRFAIGTAAGQPSTGSASVPTAAVGSNGINAQSGDYVSSTFSTGQGKWITMNAASVANLVAGGRIAIIGPGASNSQSYYSKWYDHVGSGAPQIRITYVK